ncbi:hypothetical protein MPSEU_000331100 [Mayamaea pseudoterrestris]|nr:hypothetical protein MPSEU_000331100 [Mayamaea pseudoterrestris]
MEAAADPSAIPFINMQKRKTHFVLPVTQDDAAASSRQNGSSGGSRRTKKSMTSAFSLSRFFGSRNDMASFVRFLSAIFALGLLVVGVQRLLVVRKRGSGFPSYKSLKFPRFKRADKAVQQHKALAQYSSLQYALDNSQLVGIYFGASWCPETTKVTEKIDESLSDILLPPPSTNKMEALAQRHGLSLVYVSSDRSVDEFNEYIKNHAHWMVVPYDSPEVTGLKRHFKTCALEEVTSLKLDRKHEIPTLVIVDGASHQVLTFGGAQDVLEHGAGAVDEWFKLAQISQALDHKYDTDARREQEEGEEEGSEEEESGSDSGDEGV